MRCGQDRGHVSHHQNCGKHHSIDCGCGHHHGGVRHHSARCSCGSSFERRFQTKEEKIKRLEQYLDSLQKETQAVQEHIAALGSE